MSKKLVLIILLLSNFSFILGQISSCDYNLEVLTDFLPSDCYKRTDDANSHFYYKIENCLPICKKFEQNYPTSCLVNDDCLPGYKCVNKRCSSDISTCAIYYVPKQADYFKSLYRPNCDTDGSWAPKQCKGEATTGRCFCYSATGQRIYGNEWTTKAADMTCACSRKKEELRVKGLKTYVSLHCDSMGNYEPLQCDTENGLCWCADNKSGDLKSIIVPIAALNRLPCYKSDTVGGQYLRQCDSLAYARATVLNKFKLHGSTGLGYGPLLCDEDGTYGIYKILNGIAYCTWKDNSNIQTWQSPATEDLASLNCNCARDSIIFSNAGQSLTQYCLPNGNYQSFQKVGNDAYCIDSDGFQNNYDPVIEASECDAYSLP